MPPARPPAPTCTAARAAVGRVALPEHACTLAGVAGTSCSPSTATSPRCSGAESSARGALAASAGSGAHHPSSAVPSRTAAKSAATVGDPGGHRCSRTGRGCLVVETRARPRCSPRCQPAGAADCSAGSDPERSGAPHPCRASAAARQRRRHRSGLIELQRVPPTGSATRVSHRLPGPPIVGGRSRPSPRNKSLSARPGSCRPIFATQHALGAIAPCPHRRARRDC